MTGRGRMIKIQPFKLPSADSSSMDQAWNLIRDAIGHIFSKNSSDLSFEELYRNGYNMVIHKKGDRLYNGTSEQININLKKRLPDILETSHQDSLAKVICVWNEHEQAVTSIRDVLMYMERQHIPNVPGCLSIYDLGVKMFLTDVIRNVVVKERTTPVALEMIERERQGDAIDRNLLKGFTSMLIRISSDRRVYVEEFETKFLEESKIFYQKESNELIQGCSCYDYLRKCEARLLEEKDRAAAYLDPKTEPLLRRVILSQMIEAHMSTLIEMENSGLMAMIRDQRIEDMKLMSQLFESVPEGLSTISQSMCLNVRETGKSIIQDPENLKEPITYIQKIFELRDKFEDIIHKAFNNNRFFLSELNKAFESFINSSSSKTPEFLSLFIDEEVKKQKGTETELEQILDKSLVLFRFLGDKDIFLKYYMSHMSKRLLGSKSHNEDTERFMITKLKQECGHQFTAKLESMLNDVRVSSEITSAFKEHTRTLKEEPVMFDLTVSILTTGCWPADPPMTYILPTEMEKCLAVFRTFYLGRHNGRKLVLVPNKGTGDMIAYFGDEKHELNVTTNIMIILLHFNLKTNYSLGELEQLTSLPKSELKRNLQSLANGKFKILTKEPKGRDVEDGDKFGFNEKFTNKMYRIKISPVSTKKETEEEVQETKQKVDEDRKHQIEAAIVRVMKAKKKLEHNELIVQVTEQLKARFMPSPLVIKARIESLIEREYLERSSQDLRVYQYVA